MFFTTVAFYGAWILFIFGCMGVLVPFAQKSPPPGVTNGQLGSDAGECRILR